MKAAIIKNKALLNSNSEGFLLVELALVLMILGTLVGPGLSLLRSYRTTQAIEMTKAHQKLVFVALVSYFSHYGYLPCPTDPGERSARGKAPITCAGKKAVGLVPYRTLGLPLRVAKDGYGRWMTYAIDAHMTTTGHKFRNSLCKMAFEKLSTLDIQEGDIPSLTSFLNPHALENRYDGIAWILISHGPSGYGAFTEGGARMRHANMGTCKKLNCPDQLGMNLRNPLKFCAAPPSLQEKEINDDLLWWMTRTHLFNQAGIPCADVFFPLLSP